MVANLKLINLPLFLFKSQQTFSWLDKRQSSLLIAIHESIGSTSFRARQRIDFVSLVLFVKYNDEDQTQNGSA